MTNLVVTGGMLTPGLKVGLPVTLLWGFDWNGS